MDTLSQITERIIKEQELVIGPLAWSEAKKVLGLTVVETDGGHVRLSSGDPKSIVDNLIARYERLFGRAAQEVCRDATRALVANMQPSEVPQSLR